MAEWVIFGLGFAAGAATGLRNLPLAALGLGLVMLIAGLRLGVFY
jgi:hypothetical protein